MKNLIKRAIQTDKADDSKDKTNVKIKYMGQERDIKQLTPYGFYSSSPVNSEFIVFSARANPDDLHGLGNDYKNRIKNLKEGEVALYHTKKKTLIHFKDDGSMYFSASGGLVIDSESTFNEDVIFKKNVNIDGILTLAGVVVNGHDHGGVTTGGSNTAPMA